MSKYTTQLRFVCEQAIGLEESGGYEDIESTITRAAPLIFNFPYPIFDENYRLPLEKKILRHYFMREIGQETIGEFKYRLSVKMNEIMPLMNQYYQSALLSFNPLHDTDLWTDHNKNFDERSTGNSDKTAYENSDRQLNRTISDIFSGEKITDNNTTEQGNINVSGDFNNTENTENTNIESTSGQRNTTGNKTTQEQEQYGKNTNTDSTGRKTTDTDNTETETIGTNDNTTTTGTTQKNATTHNNEVRHEDDKNFNWNLYSDTPQGSVKIFGGDVVTGRYNADPQQGQTYNPHNDAIIDTVAGESYLTDARRVIDHSVKDGTTTNDGTANETITAQGNESKIGSKNRTVNLDGNETENTSGNITGTESGNKTTTITENYNEGETTSGTLNGTATGERVSNGEHSEATNKTNNIEFDGRITDATRRDITTNENENREQNNTENIATIGTINNTENYIEHIAGKRGGHSYSELLIKFRESFINTDMMVIDSLNSLFFGLW